MVLLVLSTGWHIKQESPANAKGTRDSSACMKAHCEQM